MTNDERRSDALAVIPRFELRTWSFGFDSGFGFRSSGFRPPTVNNYSKGRCIMLLANKINRRNRNRFDPSNVPTGSDATATLAIVTGKVVVTLSVACSLSGIPQILVQGA